MWDGVSLDPFNRLGPLPENYADMIDAWRYRLRQHIALFSIQAFQIGSLERERSLFGRAWFAPGEGVAAR